MFNLKFPNVQLDLYIDEPALGVSGVHNGGKPGKCLDFVSKFPIQCVLYPELRSALRVANVDDLLLAGSF